MRILDEYNNEIAESDVDEETGYLLSDKFFVKHHEAQPEVQEKARFFVKEFTFEDGSKYVVESQDDPHVEIIDAELNLFRYVPLEGEEPKKLFGSMADKVVEVEYQPEKEAWDEYEDVLRYVAYTVDELAKISNEKRQKEFLASAPESMEDIYEAIAELGALVASMMK